jgi:hypothetical protein
MPVFDLHVFQPERASKGTHCRTDWNIDGAKINRRCRRFFLTFFAVSRVFRSSGIIDIASGINLEIQFLLIQALLTEFLSLRMKTHPYCLTVRISAH